MLNNNCSSEKHKEKEAKIYCIECKINICNICEKLHSELFSKHHIYNIDSKEKNIFTGFCQEKNHNLKLEYHCKKHNVLCCAACICKIKAKGYGNHNRCNVHFIKDIKEKKKNKLSENIKYLTELNKTLDNSIKDLRILYNDVSEKKEKLKLEIQKVFTNLRNNLNKREDLLLLEVDKKYDELFFKEELIKESEKLPNKIKISLEKGIISDNDWNDINKLSSIINDCINIENGIKDINLIDDKIKKCNLKKDVTFIFDYKDNEEKLLNNINEFGSIKEEEKMLMLSQEVMSQNEEPIQILDKSYD